MKKLIVVALMIVGMTFQARATTSYTMQGADLRDASSVLAPQTSIALMVLDVAGNGFTTPSAGFSLSVGATWGDDLVVELQDLTLNGIDGVWSGGAVISYSGSITVGDQFRLYWFPTLTISTSSLTAGDDYGEYGPDLVGLDGSAVWALPADTGSSLFLGMTTASQSGSVPDSAGVANLNVIPEPSTFVLAALGLLGAVALRRRS